MATPVAKDERSCSDADAAATSAAVHDEDPAERAVSEHDEAQTPRKRKLNAIAGGDAGTNGTAAGGEDIEAPVDRGSACLLYTSPSPRDATLSRMPSSA